MMIVLNCVASFPAGKQTISFVCEPNCTFCTVNNRVKDFRISAVVSVQAKRDSCKRIQNITFVCALLNISYFYFWKPLFFTICPTKYAVEALVNTLENNCKYTG